MKVQSVNTATHTLTYTATTKFAHAESTKVTVIQYNQVRFYHTTNTTFSAIDPVTGYIDIQADGLLTYAYDKTNTTGYGWFIFYNETTAKASSNSNAIPYGDFAENSVKKIFDLFLSQLNNKEKRLIGNSDLYSYLNEGYSHARNHLNLVTRTDEIVSEDIVTASGTAETSLSSNFSKMISVYDTDNDRYIDDVGIKEVDKYGDSSSNVHRYYIRSEDGTYYIGFSPTPGGSYNYTLRYRTKTTALNSYYDNVNLPDNSYYILIDWMSYRASQKLNRGSGENYRTAFWDSINNMKLISFKKTGERDEWSIDASSNI